MPIKKTYEEDDLTKDDLREIRLIRKPHVSVDGRQVSVDGVDYFVNAIVSVDGEDIEAGVQVNASAFAGYVNALPLAQLKAAVLAKVGIS
ncbi:MAG: hypothetical protein GY835_23885 [bacterium]|nr:hypothetical protein [bacterium]